MKISISIMAHPKRKAAAETLYKQLKQYPFSDVYIIWDELNDEWQTGERALKGGIVLGSDWHMVIQDDAILTPNFYENVEGAIKACPTRTLISLYTGTVKPLSERVKAAVDKAKYVSWLKHYLLFWGVCIVIPCDHIGPMLEFIDGRKEEYDFRIGIFYQRNMLPVYYTMPSLVDHDDDLGSLIENHTTQEPRKAHKLAEGLVRWNNKVIDI